MKKILFSTIAAVISVMGYSVLKVTQTLGEYYWFTSYDGVYNATNRPSAVDLNYQYYGSTPPLDGSCLGSYYYCVIGYTFYQIKRFEGAIPTAFKTFLGEQPYPQYIDSMQN